MDMNYLPIAFIGAGNMSRAIISGMISNGYPADKIMASNPSLPKLESLQENYGIQITQDNNVAINFGEAVVLAVKPQLMEQVCYAFRGSTDLSNKLFVSIAAGIDSARLLEMLGGQYPLVRTMPNTPSSLGKGMTGLFSNNTSVTQKQYAEQLMSMVGEVVWVDREDKINGVIAAAGSSPAYFFLFLEAMQNKTEQLGFDQKTARLMVQQAMLGAAEMVCNNPDLELSTLRAQVTSKGGTTAKAIEHFQANYLERIVAEAMQAAIDRADQMSAQF